MKHARNLNYEKEMITAAEKYLFNSSHSTEHIHYAIDKLKNILRKGKAGLLFDIDNITWRIMDSKYKDGEIVEGWTCITHPCNKRLTIGYL